MTCIVGLKRGGVVYIGGDSAGVAGLDLTVRQDGKVFQSGPFLFGFTSSFRMGQLLRYSFTPPKHHPDMDTMAYMVGPFVDGVRACLKAGGFAKQDNQVETAGTFLVAYQDRLFCIHGDYQVGEAEDPFDAIGCGDAYAKGAMWATLSTTGEPHDIDPEKAIYTALLCAERHSAGVRSPFYVLSTKKGGSA
ncbi:hypothetical protein [Hydrogenophaga sp.]|uniref:hypothetical protein n=1 Tax=Hydrogenophaga sp. TaxID=1904254 RepID=UPI00272F0A3F|nr:hypothetical protein [Hydrogenophaga sp.]MDP1686861.1 hypothetical protein [Hydrogenophaga sp.]